MCRRFAFCLCISLKEKKKVKGRAFSEEKRDGMGTWRSFFSFCPVTARLLVRRGGVGGALAAFGSSSFFWRVWVCVCVWGEGGGPPLGYTVPPERTRPALGAKEGTGGARRRGRPTDAGRAFFFFFFFRTERKGREGR